MKKKTVKIGTHRVIHTYHLCWNTVDAITYFGMQFKIICYVTAVHLSHYLVSVVRCRSIGALLLLFVACMVRTTRHNTVRNDFLCDRRPFFGLADHCVKYNFFYFVLNVHEQFQHFEMISQSTFNVLFFKLLVRMAFAGSEFMASASIPNEW